MFRNGFKKDLLQALRYGWPACNSCILLLAFFRDRSGISFFHKIRNLHQLPWPFKDNYECNHPASTAMLSTCVCFLCGLMYLSVSSLPMCSVAWFFTTKFLLIWTFLQVSVIWDSWRSFLTVKTVEEAHSCCLAEAIIHEHHSSSFWVSAEPSKHA